MAPPVCKKCDRVIVEKKFLKCAVCNCSYDITCTSVTFKSFLLMSDKGKKEWKCHPCWTLIHDQNNMPEQQNVTHRKKHVINVSTGNSFCSLLTESDLDDSDDEMDSTNEHSDNSTSGNRAILNRSCPNLKSRTIEDLEDLEKRFSALEKKCASAEQEIDNLMLENNCLRKKIEGYELKIKKLTTICKSTEKKYPSNNKSAVKSVSDKHTPKRMKSTLNFSDNQDVAENQEHPVAKPLATPTSTPKATPSVAKAPKKIKTEPKLCIISSNTNNLLGLAEENFNQVKLCHYRIPDGGTRELLYGLQSKLQGFTLQDFCVIFIGDSDFRSTSNYRSLIEFIREELQKVLHTNVIICLPTYRIGNCTSLFNYRIELFNSLLYTDNLTYEYAYIVDSNKNLLYSPAMFSNQRGSINKRGQTVVFNDVLVLMKEIHKQHLNDESNNIHNSSINNKSTSDEFFLES